MIVSIFLCVLAHSLNTFTAESHSDVGSFLRIGIKRSIHMPAVFNIRLFLLSVLLFAYHLTSSIPSYLAIATQIAYLMFVVICRPHNKGYDFFRSLCLELGLLWILVMRQVEINVLKEEVEEHSLWYPAIAYLEYTIYLLGIVVTVISYVYHIFLVSRNRKVGEISESRQNMNETLEDLNASQAKQNQIDSLVVTNIEDKVEPIEATDLNASFNYDEDFKGISSSKKIRRRRKLKDTNILS
jgi:hypothetical protein